MSLQAIRDIRIQRKKPDSVLTVVVGQSPKLWLGDPTLIELRPGSLPRLMDWRPVVGLWTAFYMLTTDWTVLDSAITCASDAGAKLFGFVDKGIGYPLALPADAGDSDFNFDATQTLQRIWDSLCKP